MIRIESADHGGVPLVIGRCDLSAPGRHNTALHAPGVPFGWTSPRDLREAPIRGPPVTIQCADLPLVICFQVGHKGPAPWRTLPEMHIKGKDTLRVPRRLVVQKVANHIRLASKGPHLMPKMVRIRSLPERSSKDIMDMWQKGGIELLSHIEIRPDRGTTPTPGRIKSPVVQQGDNP